MKITTEKSFSNFEFWSGAKHNAALLSYSQLDAIENALEDIYPDGMTETELNDLFWFDFEFVCECIGVDAEELQNGLNDSDDED